MVAARPDSFLAVVPAYNEARSVAGVVRSLREQAPGFDVIVVDDGSTDETAQRALEAGAEVVRLPFNLGIGGAVQAGFMYALERGYEYMAQVDGDGQHKPVELAKLVQAIRAYPEIDVVCGSRFLAPADSYRTPADSYRAPIGRRTGIQLFALILRAVLGHRVTDPTSGFRLYNRHAIRLFAAEYPHDYPEVEAVLLLHAHRLRMSEVPVEMLHRGSGRSSITRWRSVYYMIKVSLALLVGLLRRHGVVERTDPAPMPVHRRG